MVRVPTEQYLRICQVDTGGNLRITRPAAGRFWDIDSITRTESRVIQIYLLSCTLYGELNSHNFFLHRIQRHQTYLWWGGGYTIYCALLRMKRSAVSNDGKTGQNGSLPGQPGLLVVPPLRADGDQREPRRVPFQSSKRWRVCALSVVASVLLVSELSSCHRDFMAHKAKTLIIWTFAEKNLPNFALEERQWQIWT